MHAASRHGVPQFNVPSKRRWSELFWLFIWKVTYPVSNHSGPCLTSVKLIEQAGPLGHSSCISKEAVGDSERGCLCYF